MLVFEWHPAHRIRELTGRLRRMPFVVAATYALVGGAWIIYSDEFFFELSGSKEAYLTLQTYKGWFFVGVTAALLYILLKRSSRKFLRAYEDALQSEHRLELALSSAGGGIWDRGLNSNPEFYISPQLKELVGLPRDKPLTLADWSERISPKDNERIVQNINEAAKDDHGRIHDIRFRVRAENGQYLWLQSRGRVIRDGNGNPVRMIGVALNITPQVEAEERIECLTRYDAVTGLPNTATFIGQLNDLIGSTDGAEKQIAVVKIQIDDMDDLVTEIGVDGVNSFMSGLSARLGALQKVHCIAGRLGSDVFAFATPPMVSIEKIQSLVTHLVRLFERPVTVGGREIPVSFVCGACLWPGDGLSAEELLANCTHAKRGHSHSKRDIVRWFSDSTNQAFRKRSQWARDLRHAVTNGEIECHFQPIIDLAKGETAGFEALARWRHPQDGLIPPDQFIGLAEEHGHIFEIGLEILRQACVQATKWRSQSGTRPYVAVNVSPVQLDDSRFISCIEETLAETGLPPDRLELEVTESVLVRDIEKARTLIQALRDLGISVAIDDFGTGYSSLSTLGRIPFTRLKIDRSCITEYGSRDEITVIVNAVLKLSESLGLEVTAEGVTTARQAALLRDMGTHAAQGYYFSPPVKAEIAVQHLDRRWLLDAPGSNDGLNVWSLNRSNLA